MVTNMIPAIDVQEFVRSYAEYLEQYSVVDQGGAKVDPDSTKSDCSILITRMAQNTIETFRAVLNDQKQQ